MDLPSALLRSTGAPELALLSEPLQYRRPPLAGAVRHILDRRCACHGPGARTRARFGGCRQVGIFTPPHTTPSQMKGAALWRRRRVLGEEEEAGKSRHLRRQAQGRAPGDGAAASLIERAKHAGVQRPAKVAPLRREGRESGPRLQLHQWGGGRLDGPPLPWSHTSGVSPLIQPTLAYRFRIKGRDQRPALGFDAV